MVDADRSDTIARGAQEGTTDIEAASDGEPEVMGQRNEWVVTKGIWRGDAREACH